MRLFRTTLVVVGLLGLSAFGALAAKQRTARQVVLARVASSLAGVRVADARGELRPVVPDGGGVVLVLSTTCPHCHAVVEALARRTGGARLPRLHVVALEGAAGGEKVIRDLGLDAPVGGAHPDVPAFMGRLGISGTPALFAVDSAGRVGKAVFGEVSDAEAAVWVRLASGPTARPGASRPGESR